MSDKPDRRYESMMEHGLSIFSVSKPVVSKPVVGDAEVQQALACYFEVVDYPDRIAMRRTLEQFLANRAAQPADAGLAELVLEYMSRKGVLNLLWGNMAAVAQGRDEPAIAAHAQPAPTISVRPVEGGYVVTVESPQAPAPQPAGLPVESDLVGRLRAAANDLPSASALLLHEAADVISTINFSGDKL